MHPDAAQVSAIDEDYDDGSNNSKAASKEALHGAIAGSGGTFQEALRGLAGGVIFGMVSPVVGHPFDTIKTRMQAEATYHSTTAMQTVRQIYVAEGMRGFYRGFVPPLVGSMIYRGLLFSSYAGAYAACEHIPLLHDPMPYTGGLRPSVLIGALAASFARAAIESPLDFIKLRVMIGKKTMQDSGNAAAGAAATTTIKNSVSGSALQNSYRNALASTRSFMASPTILIRNVQHLYHGFFTTWLRTIGLLGSFFVMVDYSVRYIPEIVNAPGYGPFFKGGVCATAAWVFVFPLETAKSVIQGDTTGKYKNMTSGKTWFALKELYRERGFRKGWYRGFVPGASRSFVANGISMCAYSWVQEHLRD